jgi:ribosomal protein L17
MDTNKDNIEHLNELTAYRRSLDLKLRDMLIQHIKTETDEDRIKRIEILIDRLIHDAHSVTYASKMAVFARKRQLNGGGTINSRPALKDGGDVN